MVIYQIIKNTLEKKKFLYLNIKVNLRLESLIYQLAICIYIILN